MLGAVLFKRRRKVRVMQKHLVRLTNREKEVLKCIMEGQTNKEAAAALCVDKRTVDFHLSKIYEKLGVSNRVQALRQAIILGLLTLEFGEI